MTQDSTEELCDTCAHPWDPHVLFPTMHDPLLGGMTFCHVPGCQCQTTWSVEGNPNPYIPDDETVENLRTIAQTDDEMIDDE